MEKTCLLSKCVSHESTRIDTNSGHSVREDSCQFVDNKNTTVRDIAFSCDDNGAKFLRVTVWSLLNNYRGETPLRINVFEGFGGHSPENKAKLQEIVDSFNAKVSHESLPIDLSAVSHESPRIDTNISVPRAIREDSCQFVAQKPFEAKFSVRYHNVEPFLEPYRDLILNRAGSRWNVFTWTPIFAPQILSDATGNIVHLDIDMLVNADISTLFELNLNDVGHESSRISANPIRENPCQSVDKPEPYLIAAVAEYGKGDPVITEAVWGTGILPPTVTRYFNTGTIVFNAAACRAERTWEKILAWYRDHYDIADRIEQDAWNALYHDRTFLLPLKWNFHDRLIKSYPKRDPRLPLWQGNPPAECLDAALHPAILHFWGPKKPWKPCHRPYRKLYHAAMRAVGQTPPKDGWLARLHDGKHTRDLAKVNRLYRMMIGKAAPQSLAKSVKRAVLCPFEWLGIGLGVLILSNLPHRLMLALCDAASAMLYACDGHGRRLALENLRIVRGLRPLGERPVRFDPEKAAYDPTPAEAKVVRRSYRNMARTVGHVFWTLRDAKARVASVGEMDARARRFLAANRPAVTVSAHVGCWEILSQLAYLAGHEMMSVAKDIGTPAMTRLLMRARESIGQEIVPAAGAFRPLLKGIRGGKSLGLLVDQTVSPLDGGVWVRFLGRPLCVSAAPAFFAAKAKAPIVVAWSRPLKDGRYRCTCVDEIAAAEAADVWATTQRCATDLERVIRRHPSCWVMNYDFFRFYPKPKELEALRAREART